MKQNGFTLVELLIVVAIIGILGVIVVPNVTKYISSGEITAANAELRMIEVSTAAYMADTKESALPETIKVVPDEDNPLVSYISGTLKGTYLVNTDGSVTGLAYPNLAWDYKLGWIKAVK